MKAELAMECPAEFGTVPDCDCPFEHWHVGPVGMCLDIHFEEDCSVHLTLSDGEFEQEAEVSGFASLDDARPKAFEWAAEQIAKGRP